MRVTVEVDGFTYEGRWLTKRPGAALVVRGPLEYKRPTWGSYSRGEWADDAGPTGRATDRHRRWWTAAHRLEAIYDKEIS